MSSTDTRGNERPAQHRRPQANKSAWRAGDLSGDDATSEMRDRLRTSRRRSVHEIIEVGVVTLVLASLLNSSTLVAMADRQPFGWQRTVTLDFAKAVHTMAHWTLLDRPRQAFDHARGRSTTATTLDLAALGVPSASTLAPHDTATTSASPGSTTATGAGATRAPTAPTTLPSGSSTIPRGTTVPTTAPTVQSANSGGALLRTPTAQQHLRLWVGGDSQAMEFGQSLVDEAGATGMIDATLDYHVSSGLSRPDFFDWPAHLKSVVEKSPPEAMVIIFGANDAQRLKIDGHVVDVDSPVWQDEYRRRVDAVMDYLSNGRKLIWVGQPVMRDANFSARIRILDDIYEQEAAKRPQITYVDTWKLFAGPNGEYQPFLQDPTTGKVSDMRQGDGIHLSIAGGHRLAKTVLDQVVAAEGK